MAKVASDTAATPTVDTQALFSTFMEKSGWSSESIDDARAQLSRRAESIADQVKELQSKLVTVQKELGDLENREKIAKTYLCEMAQAMGKFASEKVILTAMFEAFPSASPKRFGKPAGRFTDEELARVLETMSPVGDTVTAIALRTGMETKRASSILKRLHQDRRITVSGEKRGTKYHLVPLNAAGQPRGPLA